MDSSTSTTASHTTSPNRPAMANSSEPITASYPHQQSHDHSSGTSTPTTTHSAASPVTKLKEVANPLVTALPLESTRFNEPMPAPPVSTFVQHPPFPVDPMRREYPKPKAEINVAEALAREPLPWTLGHWRKNSKEIVPRVEPEDIKRQKFEDAKAELLLDQAKLNGEKARRG